MHKKRLLLPSQLDSAAPSGLYKISRNSAARQQCMLAHDGATLAARTNCVDTIITEVTRPCCDSARGLVGMSTSLASAAHCG